ncbi:hypothetical protein ACHQM5_000868 [Ranunculus cassubicifolius]
MMRMKPKSVEMSSPPKKQEGVSEKVDWEVRPGGMLVQKRNPDSDRDSSVPPAPTIRIRVKHGSSYHEIYINSRATFGELKKLLAAPTGLHPQDQKLFFKDKERDSKAYLDVVGVKERSKIVLVEDPTSQERRFLEMRKTAKMEKAAKSISEISLEVDKLATQVSALESVISKGGKVAETTVLNLIELLMNQLIKLDGIFVDGDVKLQRKMQVTRVQKYVETLDLLKIKNSSRNGNGAQQTPAVQNGKHSMPNGHHQTPPTQNRTVPNGNAVHQTSPTQNGKHLSERNPVPIPQQQQRQTQQQIPQSQRQSMAQSQRTVQSQRQPASGGVVVTTKWETFDPPPLIPHLSSSTATPTPSNKLNWEFFD